MPKKAKTTAIAVREEPRKRRNNNAGANALSKAKIVEALRIGTTISGSCMAAGVPSATFYYWLDNDPIFADDVINARTAGRRKRAAYYEDLLLMRAQEGDTTAVIFALKSLVPEIYRERKEIFSAPVPKVYLDSVMEDV